jgi:hypothetical protein
MTAGKDIHRAIIVAIALLLTSVVGTAQSRTLLSRSALDSLVKPQLSAKGEAIDVEPRRSELGIVDANSLVEVQFMLHNTSSADITITDIRSTCGCLRIKSKPTLLAAGNSIAIEAEFNPAGRNGRFAHDILLYTSLDQSHPTSRLTVVGEVKNSDRWAHLPERMGSLCLSRKAVTIDAITEGKRRTEHIVCANSGTKELRISARSTVEGLSLRCEPEVIAAGCEAEITISFLSEKPLSKELRTMLIVDGIDCSPADRMISITLKK